MSRSPVLVLALSVVLAVGLPGDAPERGRTLIRMVPGLEHEVAFHLVHDSDRDLAEFCVRIGHVRTKDALGLMLTGFRSDTPEHYERTRRALYPQVHRMSAIMDSVFDRPEFASLHAFRASLPDGGYTHHRLLMELFAEQTDEVTAFAVKLKRYESLAERFMALGDVRELITIETALAREVMGDEDAGASHRAVLIQTRMRLLWSALRRAERLGENHLICQLLGELGDGYDFAGHTDSMLACYREGIERAERHRIPDQAARIRLFLAKHYIARGRLAAAASLLHEAQSASRRLGGSPLEIRVVVEGMQYHADLKCWDMVHREAARLPVMTRALERAGNMLESRLYSLHARRLHAEWLAAMGRASESAESLATLIREIRPTGSREAIGPLLLQHAKVLLEARRPSEARAAALAGLAFADSNNFMEVRSDLKLVCARAALAEGHLEDAEKALAESSEPSNDGSQRPLPPSWMRDGIAARIAVERNDLPAAERLLRRGLGALRDSVGSMDRGPHSDLKLQAAEDLWLVGHRIYSHSPARELEFERRWRALVSWIGDASAPRSGGGGAAAGPLPSVSTNSVSLVYAVMPEGIVRWTVLASGVRRETLPLDANECRALVEQVFELASTDPERADAPMPADVVGLARSLGRVLLPQELRTGRYERVSISAEGPLARLPFELLDASSDDDYEPLLSRADVRYSRHRLARERTPGGGPSLVLADPMVLPAQKRSPLNLAPLPAVEQEVRRATATLPDARVVRANETSKRTLLDAWSRSGIIYVAAHLVRDPNAPVLSYFPITFERDIQDDRFLDIRDVRETDLSRCRLVVLSSCASGEPYVAGTRSGPSMADAFLDAGGEAVIHTRWRVRDESAAETAPRLAKAWLSGTHRDGDAWRAARLELLRGPHGIRHPFEWAAWSVTTATPVSEWTGVGAGLSVERKMPAAVPPAVPVETEARSR